MKTMINTALLGVTVLLLGGCYDTTNYSHSAYTQINITKLDNIQGRGYKLEGDGKMNYIGGPINLYFCKGNRFVLQGDQQYEGTYRVDLARDRIVMTEDNDLDNAGKPLKITVNTRSGYFEQKKKYVFEGLDDVKWYDLINIDPSDCVIPSL